MTIIQRLTPVIAAGAVGGAVQFAVQYLLAVSGIVALLGLERTAPENIFGLLHMRIAWGILWGLLLLIPLFERSWWKKGLFAGTLAALILMVILMPIESGGWSGQGLFAADMGAFGWLYVLIIYLAWGLSAAFWYRKSLTRA